jgi:hypothetical protein
VPKREPHEADEGLEALEDFFRKASRTLFLEVFVTFVSFVAFVLSALWQAIPLLP